MDYETFLYRKQQIGGDNGFDVLWQPSQAFEFQSYLIEWALRKGRSAIFADCGLGKTLMQLTWAENVRRKTGRPVLVLTPLAVSQQTISEGQKFGIESNRCQDGDHKGGIVVTNYQRLKNFSPDDFAGVVCDESSILKSFTGQLRKQITRFTSKMQYRLLCTATAAPNDYVELGTSSEALGELKHSEMLKMFFKYLDDKGQKSERKKQNDAEKVIESDANYYKKLAYRISQTIGQWRLKHHAVDHFWRWVSSWSRACRMPSDLGFSDDGYDLPPLMEKDHVIKASEPPPGMLFNVPAVGMAGEREERKRTINERCEYVAGLVDHDKPAVVWCHYNPEGDLLEKLIPDARQISGSTPDDAKEKIFDDFASGQQRVLVIKPKIGAWGLNWQHCAHVVTFATHSYEQYYQSIRRCYRFGQKNPVRLDVVTGEGEVRVLGNMRSKANRAEIMFEKLVENMQNASKVESKNIYTKETRVPAWL